jgi:SPP1 gp7 family putative phage head morphogenesis protein
MQKTLHNHAKACHINCGCKHDDGPTTNAKSKVRVSPLRRDPQRITQLRKSFVAQMRRRLTQLKRAITEVVGKRDVFRLNGGPPDPFVANFSFDTYGIDRWKDLPGLEAYIADPSSLINATTPSAQLQAYKEWLKEQVDKGLLEVMPGYEDKPWSSPYIESSYKKAVVRTYNDINGMAATEGPFGLGSRAQFLNSAFGGPVGTRQLQLLATRAFQQLEGVTAAMEQQMSRILADGFAHGIGSRELGRRLNEVVTGLGQNRATTIARTELAVAYSEGQLDSMDQMQVEKVGVMAEWSTAGDDRVCPACAPLEGMILTIAQARGMIPRHPNCRCAFVDAMVGEKPTAARKFSKEEVDEAMDASIKATARKGQSLADAKKESKWAGSRVKIRKQRAPDGFKFFELDDGTHILIPTDIPGPAAPMPKGTPKAPAPGLPAPQAPAVTFEATAEIFNQHSKTAVVRWLGQQNWDADEVIQLLQRSGIDLADSTVKIQVRAGANGTRGAVASLTDEQAALLRALRQGAAPDLANHSKTGVVRWMGKNDISFAEAKVLMEELGLEVADATIRAQLRAGVTGQRGAPASLTQAEAGWIEGRVVQLRNGVRRVDKPKAPSQQKPLMPEPARAPAKPSDAPDWITTGTDADSEFARTIYGHIPEEGIESIDDALSIGNAAHRKILDSNPELKEKFERLDYLKTSKVNDRRRLELEVMPDAEESALKLKALRESKELRELEVEICELYSEAVVDAVKRVRATGRKFRDARASDKSGLVDGTKYFKGNAQDAYTALQRSAAELPADWIDMIDDLVSLEAGAVDRGFFQAGRQVQLDPENKTQHLVFKQSDEFKAKGHHKRSSSADYNVMEDQPFAKINAEINSSGKKRSRRVANENDDQTSWYQQTQTHEICHALENASGHKLTELEREFIAMRVRNSKSRLPSRKKMTVQEKTKKGKSLYTFEDDFNNRYSGKLYCYNQNSDMIGRKGMTIDTFMQQAEFGMWDEAYEVITMGVEGLFHGAYETALDDSYRDFILGLLLGW